MRKFLALAFVLTACGTEGGSRVDDVLALDGDIANGETVYADNCALCHAADGTGGVGPALTSLDADEEAEVAEAVLFGEGEMTPYDGVLTDKEIADVTAYVMDAFAN